MCRVAVDIVIGLSSSEARLGDTHLLRHLGDGFGLLAGESDGTTRNSGARQLAWTPPFPMDVATSGLDSGPAGQLTTRRGGSTAVLPLPRMGVR